MKSEQGQETQPADEVVVFCILQDAKCAECGEELYQGSFLRIEQERPLCLGCADLDHLVFLPRGDTALTRRSRKYSKRSAVVVRFSPARGHYERQGLLVEPAALAQAEAECLTDEARRERARARAEITREKLDQAYVAEFSAQIRALYPGCPAEDAGRIASHACAKYSGRVGRSARAKKFDAAAIGLAVRAFIRHTRTDYDRLLNRGVGRADARAEVAARLAQVESAWRQPT